MKKLLWKFRFGSLEGRFSFVEVFKHKMGSHLFGDSCIEKEIKQMLQPKLFGKTIIINTVNILIPLLYPLHFVYIVQKMKIAKVGRNLFPQSSQSSNLHDTDQITTLI